MKKTLAAALGLLVLGACSETPADIGRAPGEAALATAPKGQQGRAIVTGKYNAYYYDDAAGRWFFDLGDGRTQSSAGVSSPADLDQATLTECVYQNHYRGSFGDDPFMDDGWIINNVNCKGYWSGTYNALIVHRTDPRYRGIPENAIWGTWEYHVDTWFKQGNMARPQHHVGG